MRGIYIGNNRLLINPVWGGKLIVPSEDFSITPELLLKGSIELPLTNFFREKIKPGNTIVDVGANVGYFSILFGYLLGPGGKLYVYEANPKLFSYLIDNLSINYLRDRAEPFNLAVYSETKTISFFSCNRFMGNSSIHKHDETYKRHYADDFEALDVQGVTLDAHLGERLGDGIVDFLKIDIEGGEYHAFLGMESLIRQNKIKTVVFELNKGMLQNEWDSFIKLLTQYRDQYHKKFFLLDHNGSEVPSSIEELKRLQSYPHVIMTDA